ncbi:Hcp1 family type VI secretion system effector [Burkholderia ubonensis]|uniref:Hcp family type VI secretion system effector n=1 Tax=Burkholderia ubonensis TaxID=101571 RepID=UPI00075B0503|nr:type VI secretion system tube protein Hcp [Burkholderia ubonensis]KVC67095.1 Hcp1 family type VI secretion system effector [Burkholderia ubonensis]KVD95436.1 Hcp1 family type VI secretion system effector [Burkholderia ubonensis]
MAQDIFLKLTAIDGESQDARHPNEIDALTWDWSVSQQSTMHSGTGGGAIPVTRKAGGTPLEYLKITMNDVLITRIRPTANYNMAMPREEVQLSLACVMQDYVIQNAQGGSGGIVSMGYDIQANKAI